MCSTNSQAKTTLQYLLNMKAWWICQILILVTAQMEYIATMYLVTFLEADGRFSWDEIDWGEVCPQVRSKHGLSCYLTALMTTRWGRFLEFDDGIEHEYEINCDRPQSTSKYLKVKSYFLRRSLDHFLRLCDNRKNLACRIFGLWSLVHLTSTRREQLPCRPHWITICIA